MPCIVAFKNVHCQSFSFGSTTVMKEHWLKEKQYRRGQCERKATGCRVRQKQQLWRTSSITCSSILFTSHKPVSKRVWSYGPVAMRTTEMCLDNPDQMNLAWNPHMQKQNFVCLISDSIIQIQRLIEKKICSEEWLRIGHCCNFIVHQIRSSFSVNYNLNTSHNMLVWNQ